MLMSEKSVGRHACNPINIIAIAYLTISALDVPVIMLIWIINTVMITEVTENVAFISLLHLKR